MPALNRKAAIAKVILLMALAGCSKHSEDFNNIKRIDESKWVSHAQHLPVERRLNLYEELYHSSHPPNTVISSAFRDNPIANYKLVVDRMINADQGNALSYLPILADLQQSTNVNICNTNKIRTIRNVLSNKNYDLKQREAINTWKLGRCGINLKVTK